MNISSMFQPDPGTSQRRPAYASVTVNPHVQPMNIRSIIIQLIV